MTKYLNFFESESGFTEAVGAGELFYPNVSYTEEDDTVHWNLAQPADPVETPMLRMSFSTSTPGQEVALHRNDSDSGVTAMEIDGTPVNFVSGGTYSVAEPGNHTAVYQFASPEIPVGLFLRPTDPFTAFTSAEIISPVTSIVSNAFDRCTALSSVTIPDSVTTIGFGAFSHTGLRSITVPDSVTSLGAYSFMVCTEMESAVIGSGITTIPFQALRDCTSLQSVTLPDGLTSIGQGALSGCSSLYDINIPSGVTTIDGKAFSGCTGLTAIYLNPETPPTLGANALDNTNDCPIYVPAASVEAYKQAWPECAARIMSMGGGEPDQYNISASVNDETLGRVNLEQETASEGDHVDFHVDVFEMDRYQVSSVSITDGNGDEVEYEGDEYDYYFEMPASDVTIFVTIGEKQKHTVTVNSTDDLVNPDDIHFNSDDGEPSFGEGSMANFSFNLPEDLQLVSVQASDCDGNSIEVELEDEGDGFHFCYFTMPHCDVSVFITLGDKPKYNISASVNDDSLGQVSVQETASEGEQVFVNVSVNDGYRVASLVITDAGGNELEHTGHTDFELGHYDCYFDMPASDVTISVTIGEKPIGQYHISVDLNDGSQGEVSLFKETAQETANEGDTVRLQVNVFDPENYRVGLVSVTDGNGGKVQVTNEHYDNYYHFTMPASDVTIRVVMVNNVKQ